MSMVPAEIEADLGALLRELELLGLWEAFDDEAAFSGRILARLPAR